MIIRNDLTTLITICGLDNLPLTDDRLVISQMKGIRSQIVKYRGLLSNMDM
ncbi:MAG: hypothetical protein KJP23_01855 [Deltaproteobacteria bacterium]|nr:hypothetical protein [Deltaproteobacteria bacterium]